MLSILRIYNFILFTMASCEYPGCFLNAAWIVVHGSSGFCFFLDMYFSKVAMLFCETADCDAPQDHPFSIWLMALDFLFLTGSMRLQVAGRLEHLSMGFVALIKFDLNAPSTPSNLRYPIRSVKEELSLLWLNPASGTKSNNVNKANFFIIVIVLNYELKLLVIQIISIYENREIIKLYEFIEGVLCPSLIPA